jgi:hypothetical protein
MVLGGEKFVASVQPWGSLVYDVVKLSLTNRQQ